MNRKFTIFISMALIFGMMAQIGMVVDSFPGFHSGSECSYCHNEPATAFSEYYNNATITLDGQLDEEHWSNYEGRRNMVPVVAGSNPREEIYIETLFAQNTTHLFVALEWSVDSRTVVANSTGFDGIAIMWNMNASDMAFNIKDGMQLEDGYADMWFWEAPTADHGKNNTALSSAVKDYSVNDGGWDKSETTDVMAGVAHHAEIVRGSYSTFYVVEFSRKLTTAEMDADVQFKYDNYYEYAVALWDIADGSDHLMGYPHELFVKGTDGADPAHPVEMVTDHYTNTKTTTKNTSVAGANVTVTEADSTVTNVFTQTKTDAPFLFGFFGVSLFSIVGVMIYNRRRN